MNEHSTPTLAKAQPVTWKLWLLMSCGIYPIITLLAGVTQPLLSHLPMPLRFAVIVPVMVAVMVWFVLPQLHRRFGGWLVHPRFSRRP